MQIKTTSDALIEQLQVVSRAAPARSPVQALAGIQLATTDNGIELRSTDRELSLRVSLEAEVVKPGSVVLPARLLLDLSRALPRGEVSLKTRSKEGDLELLAGRSNFHIRTLRDDDFPELPTASGDSVTLPSDLLVESIERVARSASRDETRPVLAGILVSVSGGTLRMVATDSYRLSVDETPLTSPIAHDFEANVPARALQELARIAGDTEEVAVSVAENQIVFSVGGRVLASRLIDGQFPNYKQLIPDEFEHDIRLSTEEIAAVVKRISLLAPPRAPLRLAFSDGELTISAKTPEIGEAQETLPVPFSGEAFEIGFNPEFLRDGFESVGGDEIMLRLITPLRPGLLEAADGGGLRYLLMPIRIET